MEDSDQPDAEHCTTGQLAAAVGCSAQLVRDLERLEVIPPAGRRPNGYRRFGTEHLVALRAYGRLAVAVGPVIARSTMRALRSLPHDEAVARIVALHVDLARSRDQTLQALRALDGIIDEGAHEAAGAPEDSMSITELASALGVRSSTLRFWEDQGLLSPERSGRSGGRRYPPDAVRDARIVAALRAGGYGIPDVRAVMAALRSVDDAPDAREALRRRLRDIGARSEALLLAGSDIAGSLPRTGTPTAEET